MTTGLYAIGPKKKGRVGWAAWWTSRPTPDRFTLPDARGDAVDENAARHGAFQTMAKVRGCRSWIEIDARFAVAAERQARGEDPPWPGAKKAKPIDVDEKKAYPDVDLSPLGLSWPTTLRAVRAAYKAKVAELHPDKGGSHEDMVGLNRAFAAAKKALEG